MRRVFWSKCSSDVADDLGDPRERAALARCRWQGTFLSLTSAPALIVLM